MDKKSRPKPRKSLTENFKNEIINHRIPGLKRYRNKFCSQLEKLKERSNILKSKINKIDIETEEGNHYKTTYREIRINLSHNTFSSPDEYCDCFACPQQLWRFCAL